MTALPLKLETLLYQLGHGEAPHNHVPVAENCTLRLGMIWAGYECKVCARKPADRCQCGRAWPCSLVPEITQAYLILEAAASTLDAVASRKDSA